MGKPPTGTGSSNFSQRTVLTTAMHDFIRAVEVSAKLRDGFKSVADLMGAERAFYVFGGEVVKAGLDAETEEKFIRLIRAAHDEYMAETP